LAADKGQVAGIQAFAVVGVNEINAGIFVFDNDAAGLEGGRGKVGFDFEDVRVARFADDGGL
jgi:hypothetical protein